MQAVIDAALRVIEQERGIKIIYAAEAGSRAWGFPSRDSDYDIRIIYIRPLKDYFRVHPLADNFEHKLIHGDGTDKMVLDIAGWELNKALGLLAKSNPPLVEWLESPIRYVWRQFPMTGMMDLHNIFFDQRAFLHHYTNMASRCLTEHLRTPTVKLKKYFYSIRPLLAAHFVMLEGARPPVDFMTLFDSQASRKVLKDPLIRNKINDLYRAKLGSLSEADRVIVDVELLDWIESQITFLRAIITTIPVREMKPQPAFDALDAFFYRMVTVYEERVSGVESSA